MSATNYYFERNMLKEERLNNTNLSTMIQQDISRNNIISDIQTKTSLITTDISNILHNQKEVNKEKIITFQGSTTEQEGNWGNFLIMPKFFCIQAEFRGIGFVIEIFCKTNEENAWCLLDRVESNTDYTFAKIYQYCGKYLYLKASGQDFRNEDDHRPRAIGI